MKIVDIRVSVHRVQSALPLKTEKTQKSIRLICEVETEGGHTGFGMSGSFLYNGVKAMVLEDIKPAVLGCDARHVEAIHQKLKPIISNRGTQRGANLQALSAVDLALWDVVGKARGESVAVMLGGARTSVPVYVTFGFGAYDQDELVELARQLVAQGHKRLKMLVGVSGNIAKDVERVRTVRKAIGSEVMLALDANETLSIDEAVRLARMVEDLDIAWFEDAIRATDAADLASLRSRTAIPLSGGQMDGHTSRFREWLMAGSLDILMPNGMYNGGMTEVRKVAALAQTFNKPLSDAGGGGIFCLHHVAGFRNGTYAERHLGVENMEEALFEWVPKPVDGMLEVPDAPGWGLTLDRDAMKETLIA